MKKLCTEPISTGIMDGKATYEPCFRPLHKLTGMCLNHAIDAGIVRPIQTPEMIERAKEGRRIKMEAKMRLGQ